MDWMDSLTQAKSEEARKNEQVITESMEGCTVEMTGSMTISPGQDTEDTELVIEQKTMELVSCGRLRRDAPGADEEEIASTDSIIDNLLRKAKEEGSATLEGSDFVYGQEDERRPESKSSRQRSTVRESLNRFSSKYAGRIREALIKAMSAEEKKKTKFSFTDLSYWDFSARCKEEGCVGRIRSNRVIRKNKLSSRCRHCGTKLERIYEYDRFEDNSNIFHLISEEVAESILKMVCTTRHKPKSDFYASLGEEVADVLVGSSDKPKRLQSGGSRRGYATREESQIRAALECITEANAGISRLGELMAANGMNPLTEQVSLTTITGSEAIVYEEADSDSDDGGAYYCHAARVRDEIAFRLKPMRAEESELGEYELEEWAEWMASHILYAIDRHDGLIVMDPASQSELAKPEENNCILKLSREATDFVHGLVLENDRLLQEFFTEETTPPMVSEPRDWVLDEERVAVGGYLTNSMRERMPFIPRESAYRRTGNRRIEITQGAIDTINVAQKTRFSVNRDMVGFQLGSMLRFIGKTVNECLELEETEGGIVIRTIPDSESRLSRLPDPQSVSMWIKEAGHAMSLLSKDFAQGGFYHPIRLDHRGRMYTSSTLLDPQGDDFSRGLIRLGSPIELDEEGWKWLRISVAKMWEGVDAMGEGVSPGKGSSFEQLLDATEDSESAFVETLLKVADDPLDNIGLWTDGYSDVFRSHAEGFQRLSATLAFADALSAGGVGAPCDYITVQDASSNIYQHMSLLLRDREMAKMVNVLETDRPADIYSSVADAMKDVSGEICENAIKGLLDLGISDEEGCYLLLCGAATRNNSKSPVMTKGYGSGNEALIEMLLTHNGKPRPKLHRRTSSSGKVSWYNTMEGREEEYIQGFLSRVNDASDSVEEIANLKSELMGSVEPRESVFNSNRKWRTEVHNILKRALGSEGKSLADAEAGWSQNLGAEAYESVKMILESTRSPWRVCAHPNSILMRIIEDIGGAKKHGIAEEHHEQISKILAKSFQEAINKVIPNHMLKSKGEFDTLKKKLDPLSWSTGQDGVKITHLSFVPPTSEPIKRRKGEQGQGGSRTPGIVSRRVYSDERDVDAEGRAIAPNFVHSLDAEHMRMVVRKLSSHQSSSGSAQHVWMVHDAFGCHPNFMSELRRAALEGLIEIHGPRSSGGERFENIIDSMHGGNFFSEKKIPKGIGTLELAELENVDLDRWYFLN